MNTNRANIATALEEMAQTQPDTLAIAYPNGRNSKGEVNYLKYTFKQLSDKSSLIAKGLENYNIKRGDRVVLMVKPSLSFFALAFALIKAGIIPVLIDPGMGLKNLKQCIAEAKPSAFIGIPKAQIARIFFGWGRETIKKIITVGPRLFWGGKRLIQIKQSGSKSEPFHMADTKADDMAAILFTSGSTGVPKGVVYSHGNFVAQLEMIRKTYNIKPGEVDLPTFPPFALFNPALGMTTILPDMDPTRPAHVDPLNIIEVIQKFQITNMFGSPALIDRVGRYGAENGIKLPSLRRVISAGAPVPAKVMARFSTMLSSEAQIFTPYGATESLPVCSIGSHEILTETQKKTELGAGICIGRPVEDMDVAIIPISDSKVETWSEDLNVPTGEVGEIVVRGPNVTEKYYNREDSTALAKIKDEDRNSIRHRMGDLGYRDESGRLWFCGRKAHRVQTESETLFTVNCEHIFNKHPAVYRTALVGVRLNSHTEPVLCVELERGSKKYNLRTMTEELLELGQSQDQTKNIKQILFHDSFPVDIRHNAKIFREKLALWAEQELK